MKGVLLLYLELPVLTLHCGSGAGREDHGRGHVVHDPSSSMNAKVRHHGSESSFTPGLSSRDVGRRACFKNGCRRWFHVGCSFFKEGRWGRLAI